MCSVPPVSCPCHSPPPPTHFYLMLSPVLLLPALSPWGQGQFCLSLKGLVSGGTSVLQTAEGHSRCRLLRGLGNLAAFIWGCQSVCLLPLLLPPLGGGAF